MHRGEAPREVEDDHPAVSAAALRCLSRSPQLPAGDHFLTRLASALRQRLRDPRSRLRSAAVELLGRLCTGRQAAALLVQTFQISKEHARQVIAEIQCAWGHLVRSHERVVPTRPAPQGR